MTGARRVTRYTGAAASVRRVRAVLRRHAYLVLKSWSRIVSMIYYPTVTMVVWAFLTLYLAPTNNFLRDAPGFFIGAVLLWDVLFRGQLGVSLTLIEELYARNLGNLFVAPLTVPEFIAGQLAMGIVRALIGVGGACLFAYLLFRYSIFSMGFPLIAFFANLLVFGWAIGLAMSGLILRLGLGAEELAWASIFVVAPVSGVYYPIAVLPGWLQAHRVVGAVGARVRRHARGAARPGLPLGPLLDRGGAQRLLSDARRRVVRLVGAPRPRSRDAAADGRVESGAAPAATGATAGSRPGRRPVADGAREPLSTSDGRRTLLPCCPGHRGRARRPET